MKQRVLENFIEKMIAFCDNPIIFISYPISEDAASMFYLSNENKAFKYSLCQKVPELSILEVKLVPAYMSRNKFNLVLFLVTADYRELEKKLVNETVSTNDTIIQERQGFEPSEFLKEQMKFMGISEDFCTELSENIAEAFAQCDINDNWCID